MLSKGESIAHPGELGLYPKVLEDFKQVNNRIAVFLKDSLAAPESQM